MGPHCLSHDFTLSAKPALEKQTSQLSPSIQQCMASVQVWLLAGPTKCNWPSVTLWSVFANVVTIMPYIWVRKHIATYCSSSFDLISAALLHIGIYSIHGSKSPKQSFGPLNYWGDAICNFYQTSYFKVVTKLSAGFGLFKYLTNITGFS